MNELMMKQLEEMLEELKALLKEVDEQVDKEKAPAPLGEGDQLLSPHFRLSEFTRSDIATRRNIDNTPSSEEISNLKALCVNVLEPIREHFGKPVVISSGYRSVKLNTAARGSRTSDHIKGYAADFEIEGVSNYKLARWIEDNLNYSQLILEFPSKSSLNAGWVHCSYKGKPHKNEEKTAVKRNGRTKYLAGLIG